MTYLDVYSNSPTSNPDNRLATSTPIPPKPTMPTVLPYRHLPP